MMPYFGPAITKYGIVPIKIGSLYRIHWRPNKIHPFTDHPDHYFNGIILIIDIIKQNFDSISLPHLHDLKFLNLTLNTVYIASLCGGGTDLDRFFFQEIQTDEMGN